MFVNRINTQHKEELQWQQVELHCSLRGDNARCLTLSAGSSPERCQKAVFFDYTPVLHAKGFTGITPFNSYYWTKQVLIKVL